MVYSYFFGLMYYKEVSCLFYCLVTAYVGIWESELHFMCYNNRLWILKPDNYRRKAVKKRKKQQSNIVQPKGTRILAFTNEQKNNSESLMDWKRKECDANSSNFPCVYFKAIKLSGLPHSLSWSNRVHRERPGFAENPHPNVPWKPPWIKPMFKRNWLGTVLPGRTRMFPSFFFFSFLGPHLQPMEVPGLGVKLELQPPAYTTATATQDRSHIWDPHHSSLTPDALTHGARPGIELC